MFLQKSQELETNGYSNQVTALSERTFVHLEDEEQNRVHLKYRDEHYYSDTEKLNLPDSQIDDFVNRNCQKISTTVISRPILRSWLLPVAAYVGGPAEIAYWCQLSPLFTEFNLTAPVLYPRKSTTLIEPKIKRFIEKLQTGY